MTAPEKIGYFWGRFQTDARCLFRQVARWSKYEPVIFSRQPLPRFENSKIKVVELRERSRSPWQVLRSLWNNVSRIDLNQAVADSGVRLLHVFYGDRAIRHLPALGELSIPWTVSFHGKDIAACLHHPEMKRMLPDLFSSAAVVMARSKHMARLLQAEGCPPGKLWIHYTGIPMDTFKYHPGRFELLQPFIFLQACRLIEKKGLYDTVEAFRKVSQEAPESVLWLAGDGPLGEPLERVVKEKNLDSRVKFLGFLDEPSLIEAMHRAHVFLHPSVVTSDGDQEGIPNALLEAMATGMVPISTRHAGIPEVIEHGQNGWLVPENSPAELASWMKWAVQNPRGLPAMGQAAHEGVKNSFSLDARTQAIEDLFEQVITGGNARIQAFSSQNSEYPGVHPTY